MPRKPRHFLVNVPCHIISRGNNHNACFFADDDKAKPKGSSHLIIKTIQKRVKAIDAL
jgi:REP element-mobilizing transposase RayT